MSSFKVPKTEYEKHPEGMYAGICYQVIDLGTHVSRYFGTAQHLLRVTFETVKKMKDGRPFSVNTRYTLSMNKKANLRKDLERWRGRVFTKEEADDFDLAAILGKPALLQIVHSEDGQYANIMGINPMPEGMAVPERVNPLVMFSIGEWDQAVFDKLPESARKLILECDEKNPDRVEARRHDAPEPEPIGRTKDDNGDDIPF